MYRAKCSRGPRAGLGFTPARPREVLRAGLPLSGAFTPHPPCLTPPCQGGGAASAPTSGRPIGPPRAVREAVGRRGRPGPDEAASPRSGARAARSESASGARGPAKPGPRVSARAVPLGTGDGGWRRSRFAAQPGIWSAAAGSDSLSGDAVGDDDEEKVGRADGAQGAERPGAKEAGWAMPSRASHPTAPVGLDVG